MPTNLSGQMTPEEVLTQLLQSSAPVYYPGGAAQPSSQAEDIYRDQPAEDFIRQYVTTGQMPSVVTKQPGGLIQHLGNILGLRSPTEPVTPALKSRAELAKRSYDREQIEANLREALAPAPGAQWFGGQFGQSVLKAAGAPGLAAAYPTGLAGKGEVALRGQELKSQQGAESLHFKEQQEADKMAIQTQLMQLRAASVAGRTEEVKARTEALIAQMQNATTKQQLEQQKFEQNPRRQMLQHKLDRLAQERTTLEGKLLEGGVTIGPEQQAQFQKRLDDLDALEAQIEAELGGGGAPPPAAAKPKAAGGYKPLATGVFGGGR